MADSLAHTAADGNKRFPCAQCGAQLSFKPGTASLKCDYCSFLNEIPQSAEDIEELDFNQYLDVARQESAHDTEQNVKCNACAAEFTVEARTTATKCPFCGSNTVTPMPAGIHIRPKSILPFAIDAKKGREIYNKWISSRFWAPNALKNYARADSGLSGMYQPYWTYDSKTTTWYSGMRGEHYYETETYTDGNGQTQTRQVRKTQWWPVSGTVWRDFDDVPVPASTTLPHNHVLRVETWDMGNLVPYRDEYLSGFQSERYNVGLEEGFVNAQGIMRGVIERDVCNDIGGDEQRITDLKTQYDAITFKHCLVPVWLGAYKFKDKTYRFIINGRTGDISGDAPVSAWKVAFAVLLGLIALGLILFLTNKN